MKKQILINKKGISGITLVALVITIIILLILSGISISQLSKSSLFSKAKEARIKSEQSQVVETINLILNQWYIEDINENKDFESFLDSKVSSGEIDNWNNNGDGTYDIEINGYVGIVNKKGIVEDQLQNAGPRPKVDNTSIVITKDDGTDIPSDGLNLGTKLKINFTATMENGSIESISPELPYITTGAETQVKFTIIGKVGSNEYTTIKMISLQDKYKTLKTGDIINYDYIGEKQQIVLPAGKYKLETWGAEGGYRSDRSKSGKGGYSVGTLTLNNNTNLFIYVGQQGVVGNPFNGGGIGPFGLGGGGASDIRIEQDSLYARIIVAGGGGSTGAANKMGMYGGGETGGSSEEPYTSDSDRCGKGGTQTYSGCSIETTIDEQSPNEYYGGFGFGGTGRYYADGRGGAGGGGWYRR